MNRDDAQSIVDYACDRYGLNPITVVNNPRMRRTLGTAKFSKREIHLALHAERDTVAHELAHYCAWEIDQTNGHGKEWKEWAIILGATPIACHGEIPDHVYRWEYYCHNGCTWKTINKRPRWAFCPEHKNRVYYRRLSNVES